MQAENACFSRDNRIIDIKIRDFRLQQKDIILETNIVERIGTLGKMKSIYLRDPDGNLIELSSYDI